MKVILLIWISAVFVREVVPGTIMRHPRVLVPEPESHNRQARHVSNPLHSSVQTEYEAMYQQKGHQGNESFSTVKGKQEIVHDNCSDNWNDFAEKCATLIKDLVASLANAISSSPGDTTNLQLQIKNSFRHFDSTNNCSCFNETKSNISKIGLELPRLLEKSASLSSSNERSPPQGSELSAVGSGLALGAPTSKSGNGLHNAAGNQRGHESGCTSDCDKEESGKDSKDAAANNQALPVFVVEREPHSGQVNGPQSLSTPNSQSTGNVVEPSVSGGSQETVTGKPNLPPYFLPLDFGKDAVGKPDTDSLMVPANGHPDGSSTNTMPAFTEGAAVHPKAIDASTNDESNCDESENGSAGTTLGTGSNEYGSQETTHSDPNLRFTMQSSGGSATPAVAGLETGHASHEVPANNGISGTAPGNAQSGGQLTSLGTPGEITVPISNPHSGAGISAVEPPREDSTEGQGNSGVLSASQQHPDITTNSQENGLNASPIPASSVQTSPVFSSNVVGIKPTQGDLSGENSSDEPPCEEPANENSQGAPGSLMPVPVNQVPASQTSASSVQVLPVSSPDTTGIKPPQGGLSGENASTEPPCDDSVEGHENTGATSSFERSPEVLKDHQAHVIPVSPVSASNTLEIEPIHEVQVHTSAVAPQTANLGAPVSSDTKGEESSDCDESEANESNNSVKLSMVPLEQTAPASVGEPNVEAISSSSPDFDKSGINEKEDSGHIVGIPVEHADPSPAFVPLPNAAVGSPAESQSDTSSGVGEEDCDDAKTPAVQSTVPQTDGKIPDKIIGFPDRVTGQSGEIPVDEHQVPVMVQEPTPVQSLSHTSPDTTSGVVSSPSFVNANSGVETKSVLHQPHIEEVVMQAQPGTGDANQGGSGEAILPSHSIANAPNGAMAMAQQPQANPGLAIQSSLPAHSAATSGSSVSPVSEPAMIPIATLAPSTHDSEPSEMWANEPKPVVISSGELDSSEGGYELATPQRPTTFQTTSAEPTPPQSLVLPTSSTPAIAPHPTSLFLNEPNSAEVSSSRPLTIPTQSQSSHHHDEEEDEEDDDDCCSCESCTDEEINPQEFRTSACKDLEQAKRELKAIFDKIKKKLKCGRRTSKAPTIALPVTPSN